MDGSPEISIDDAEFWEDIVRKICENLVNPDYTLEYLTISSRHASRGEDRRREQVDYRLRIISAVGRSTRLNHFRIHGTTQDEIPVLCKELEASPVLKEIDIKMSVELEDEFAKVLSDSLLIKNGTLKTLRLWTGGLRPSGAAILGRMLTENCTLEELDIFGNNMGGEGVEHLMKPLTENEDGQQPNTSLKQLTIGQNNMGARGAEAVAKALSRNRTLTLFSMRYEVLQEEDVCKIVKSLEHNRSLLKWDIDYCKGFNSQKVFRLFEDLLSQFNFTLRTIDLSKSDILYPTKIEYQLTQNAKEVEEVSKAMMQELPKTPPIFARIFLCGNTLAGKTSLRRAMNQSLDTNLGARLQLSIKSPFAAVKNKVMSMRDPEDWYGRTRGIKIRTLYNQESDSKISVWDLAGQEEYQAFHDFMIPNFSDRGTSSSFIIVCSPFEKQTPKDIREIENELSYWMKFIASNTRRSINAQPHVMVVITRKDKGYRNFDLIKERVENLKHKFRDFIEVSSDVHHVTANDYRCTEVKSLAKEIQRKCAELLGKLPPVFEASLQMQSKVSEWNEEKPDEPVVPQRRFNELTSSSVIQAPSISPKLLEKQISGTDIHQLVALSLNEVGEIIFFKEEDFVVMNPGWFCHEVMGQVIQLQKIIKGEKTNTTLFKNGFADKSRLEELLRNSIKTHSMRKSSPIMPQQVKSLIHLMLRLELCYEVGGEPGRPCEKVFIPVTLTDEGGRVSRGERKLEFGLRSLIEPSYLGRRLQCQDPNLTTLTPGFFPRLQVALHNYFTNKVPEESEFTNAKNLIGIKVAEMEILIELSGDLMPNFVDILIQSSRSQADTLKFLKQHVVCFITDLCYSPCGCQGVVLQEAILQTECVKQLLLIKYRVDQAVPIDLLKDRYAANPEYQHFWKSVSLEKGDFMPTWDPAPLLLGEEVTGEIQRSRQQEIRLLNDSLDDFSVSPAASEPSPHPSSIWQVSRSFNNRTLSTNEISTADVPKETILRKFDTIRDAVVGIVGQCPCFVYFTDPELNQKLMVKLQPMKMQMRLLCEHRDGYHVVPEQKGVAVDFSAEDVERVARPLIGPTLHAMTITIKMAAQVQAGMGDLVPNVGKVPLQYDSSTLPEYVKNEIPSSSEDAQKREDQARAERWLIHFLKDKDIWQDFKLLKVYYSTDGKIRWVCKHHRDEGVANCALMDLPGRTESGPSSSRGPSIVSNSDLLAREDRRKLEWTVQGGGSRLSLCCRRKNKAVVKETLKQELMKRLWESNELTVLDDVGRENFIRTASQIYKHYFEALPDDEYLPDEWIDALELLTLTDVEDVMHKYESALTSFDEIQSMFNTEVPSTSRSAPGQRAILSAENHQPERAFHSPEDHQQDHRTSRPADEKIIERMEEMERRLGRQVVESEWRIVKEVRSEGQRVERLEAVVRNVHSLQQELRSTLIEKIDQATGFVKELHDIPQIPRIPYPWRSDVKCSQWLEAIYCIGKPCNLHFMCENPSHVHIVKEQNGLPFVNLLDGDVYKVLRPLMQRSVQLFALLVKAGLHVAAGIGNVIPVPNYTGGVPFTVGGLVGESVLKDMMRTESTFGDGNLDDAWPWIKGTIEKVKAKGEFYNTFRLYRAEYKSDKLSSTSRKYFWLCEECFKDAEKANLLRLTLTEASVCN